MKICTSKRHAFEHTFQKYEVVRKKDDELRYEIFEKSKCSHINTEHRQLISL